MLRSVASFQGGPESRWTYFQKFKPFWSGPTSCSAKFSPGSAQDIYQWNHLRYAGSGPDDIHLSDVDDDIDDNGSIPPNSGEEASHMEVPCGYQDRRALRGSHREQRSESSRARCFDSWKQQQRTSRQDFRQWKSKYKDSTRGHTVIRIRNPCFVQHRQRNIDSTPNPRNFLKALINSDNLISLPLFPYPQALILILPLGMLKDCVKLLSMIKS